jgi:hypothetical protein
MRTAFHLVKIIYLSLCFHVSNFVQVKKKFRPSIIDFYPATGIAPALTKMCQNVLNLVTRENNLFHALKYIYIFFLKTGFSSHVNPSIVRLGKIKQNKNNKKVKII